MNDEQFIEPFITEESVNNLATTILEKTFKKAMEQMTSDFYEGCQDYMYEHYVNLNSHIERKMIQKLAERYVSDPTNYQYKDIRDKLFEENKDVVLASITDYLINRQLDHILKGYMTDTYWGGDWNLRIVQFIVKNYSSFENEPQFQNSVSREISRLNQTIQNLKNRIDVLECEANDY